MLIKTQEGPLVGFFYPQQLWAGVMHNTKTEPKSSKQSAMNTVVPESYPRTYSNTSGKQLRVKLSLLVDDNQARSIQQYLCEADKKFTPFPFPRLNPIIYILNMLTT